MDAIIIKLLETAGIPLAMIIIAWLVGKYLKPWVHAKPSRLERAEEISLVADRITTELCIMFPDATWDDLLDAAVDKIIDALDIPEEIARREAITQLEFRTNKAYTVDSSTSIT